MDSAMPALEHSALLLPKVLASSKVTGGRYAGNDGSPDLAEGATLYKFYALKVAFAREELFLDQDGPLQVFLDFFLQLHMVIDCVYATCVICKYYESRRYTAPRCSTEMRVVRGQAL